MSADSQPTYDALAAVLDAAGIEMSPAEAHGLIAGAVCVAARDSSMAVLREAHSVDQAALDRARQLLTALGELTQAQLNDPEFAFEPLLPQAAAFAATGALGEWCHGFLAGLAAGGLRDFGRLSSEAREFIEDVVKIAEVEPTPGETDEDEERALAEITEYLRAGVQLLFDELSPAAS
jgi:uncharacterized protein YgfB (UPF0149 family)